MQRAWEVALEAERLRLSSPETVYLHLSSLPPGNWMEPNLPDPVFDALLTRGEPLINLGLARYASNSSKLNTLFSSGGIVRLAVLANQAAWGPLDAPLTAEDIVDIHRNGSTDELAALFQNPSISPTVLQGAIANTMGGGVDKDRWLLIVALAANNERLTYKEEHDTWDEFTAAMDHEGPIAAIWDLLWRVEPTPAWASVLSTALERIPFAVKIQGEFLPDLTTADGQRDWRKTSDERWAHYHKAFIDMVATKWATPANVQSNVVDSWRYIRQAFARKFIQSRQFDYNIANNLRDHSDIGIRCGYYSSVKMKTEWQIEEFYERDGIEFLKATIENRHLYLRQNHALQSALRPKLYNVDMGHDWLIGRFKNIQKFWADKNPAIYGDEPTPEQVEGEHRAMEAEARRAEALERQSLETSTTDSAKVYQRKFTARVFWVIVSGVALAAWLSIH